MNPINDAQKNTLKQQGFAFLPKNMESIEAQKQILSMLAQVVLPVRVCAEKADREVWPKAQAGAMPLNQAVTQCAYDADKLIGMTIIDNLKLRKQNRENLLKAWIVLDYYIYVLKAEYSVNIRKLQDHISEILLSPAAAKPQPVQDIPVTVPVDLPPIKSQITKPSAPPVPKPAEKETSNGKKKPVGIIAAVVALIAVAAVVLVMVLGPISKVEKAIDAIGSVTMDSEPAIEAAEALYSELSDNQKQKVENIQVLLDARADFDMWEKSIADAIKAIDAIGDVTLDSGKAIKDARAAYEKLKVYGLEDHAAAKLPTLTRAEKAYEDLMVQSLCDDAAAKMEEKNYQEALDVYNAIVKDYPNSASIADAKTGIMDCTAELAKVKIKDNDLEGAMILLTEIQDLCPHTENYTKASESLEQRLNQIRPHNGKTFKNKVDWGWGEFTVKADKDSDAFVKVENAYDSTKFVTFYVRAGEEAKVKVKDGTYIVKYTTGKNWYGEEAMFGKDAAFTKADKNFTFSTSISGSYVYYSTISITLYQVVGGDLSTSPITSDNF